MLSLFWVLLIKMIPPIVIAIPLHYSPGMFTLPIHIANYITEHETLWGPLMGIGLLSSLPVLIISGFIQRYLIRGFAMGLK